MTLEDSWNSDAHKLPRVRRALVVVDMVESVRLMQTQEDDVIVRWRSFVETVCQQILPGLNGRMAKSLGDGMLLEFHTVAQALAAVSAMHASIESFNAGRTASRALQLRAAVHSADVVIDGLDLFGAGVNLVARLCSLGRPGAVVLSAEARDELTPSSKLQIEDLGDCWLKHLDVPVRAFLGLPVHPLAESRSTDSVRTLVQLSCSVAVVPLSCQLGNLRDGVIGDLVADGVITQLAASPELLVLSRLATAALRPGTMNMAQTQELVGARYLLGGSYAVQRGKVLLTIELSDTRSATVVWADRFQCRVGDLLQHPSQPIERIAQGAHLAILAVEASRVATQSLPTLESASLLFGGIGLLHRTAATDFMRAHEALTELTDRVPRHHAPHAWLAQWHCLRVIRGQSGFASQDAREARFRIDQALERDPDSAMAWSLMALVVSWLDKDLGAADDALRRALVCSPNEPLAWLFSATLRSWQGRGPEAAAAADRALALSGLHPLRYYFATLAAAGYLANDQYARAIDLCTESLRLNRSHTPTHRVLAISLVNAGRVGEARPVIANMLALQPGYSVARYLEGYPGGQVPHALAYAQALREAGVPA